MTGAARSKFLPDVPTMKEQGYDVVVESWLGVFLPPKTPDDITQALSKQMGEADALGRDDRQPGEVRERAAVPDAEGLHRDDQERPHALGSGGEGLGLRRGGLGERKTRKTPPGRAAMLRFAAAVLLSALALSAAHRAIQLAAAAGENRGAARPGLRRSTSRRGS